MTTTLTVLYANVRVTIFNKIYAATLVIPTQTYKIIQELISKLSKRTSLSQQLLNEGHSINYQC